MSSTTRGMQVPSSGTTAGGENRQDAHKRHIVEIAFCIVGTIILIIACFILHGHPQPYPYELGLMQTIQGLKLWPWVNPVLEFPSLLNDPIPSTLALACWFEFMLVMALVFDRKGKSPLAWIQGAVFLVVAVMASAGLNVIVDELVARPRPNPHTQPIHVNHPIVPFPTFPSGHTEHDVVYYGFLLYLSFTRPVREWRYHRWLLPLQLYAIFDLISIGYSRILEGDHWLLDVLGGYLEGAIYLMCFIFLYRWATDWLANKKIPEFVLGKRSIAH